MILNELWRTLAEHSGELFLGTRMTLHLLTIGSILSYTSQHRNKFVPTALAVLIAGFSFAAFMQGLTDWRALVFNTQPWVMGLTFCLAVICVMAKGNLSRPLWFIYR